VVAAHRDRAEDALGATSDEPFALSLEDRKDGTWKVEALFLTEPDRPALEAALSASGITGALRIAQVPDRDWVREVQSRLHPIAAGRYFVHGSHDRAARPATGIAIEIDAQAAFGTGHHGSTRGCLLALNALKRRGAHVRRALDLGTGSGVLAIAAARTWPATVLATDMDRESIPIASQNVRANRCVGSIRVIQATGFRNSTLSRARGYDLVMANILARPNIRLAPEIARALAPGGHVILSGQLVAEERRVLAAYRNHGLTPRDRIHLDEWSTVVLAR
jgi:ribosomal protein L11 methyltransferase